MKKDNLILVAFIILIIIIVVLYIKLSDFSPKPDNSLLLEKINNLELKIDSLNKQKDSIKSVIDSTHIKIITNEKHYQEKVINIISQPDSLTDLFTRQYILEYAASHGYNIR